MQELRLVGVHEDGEHLLLSGDGGSTYRLPLNEALRMATARPAMRVAPATAGGATDAHLSPRDIQTRIRNGATAQQVAADSGLELAHVLRYEGPVRAEREYMAQLAQRVEVSSPLPSHDGYRSAFGDNPAQLGEMVAYRLQSIGVDASSVEWDAWRRADGTWNVVASFEPAPGSTASVGEEPPAQWTFNPGRRTVQNANRWAQVLSELEPLDGPLPARRLSAVADAVFDFEAERDAGREEDGPEPEDSAEELLDVLRARRGQRLGEDEDEDDALALMLSRGDVPAAHPRGDGSDTAPEATGRAEWTSAGPDTAGNSTNRDNGAGQGRSAFPPLALAPALGGPYRDPDAPESTWHGTDGPGDGPEHDDGMDEMGTPRLFDGVSTETREISMEVSMLTRPSGTTGSGGPAEDGPANDAAESGTSRPGQDSDRKIRPRRSSVPSWDEIVFGTRGD